MLSRFVQISFLFSLFFPEDEVLDQQFKLRQRSVGGLILKIFQSSLKLFFPDHSTVPLPKFFHHHLLLMH